MRDDKGRFVPGEATAGPGRPPKPREERYREILLNSVSFDDWMAIVRKAASQAMKGDATAREWLTKNLIGLPRQAVDIDGNLHMASPALEEILRMIYVRDQPKP